MKYSLVIEIPGLPKTMNGSHGNWRAAAGERRKWRLAARLSAYGKRPAKPLEKAKVACTRFSSSRPDRDNLAASFKGAIDGLVDAGVLVDDSDDVIVEMKFAWEKVSPKQGKIRITVEAAK